MAIPGLNFPSSLDNDNTLFLVTNNAVTTLANSINASDTTIVLADASQLPTSGFVSIGTEIIYYPSRTGNTLNSCDRGVDGTTAAPHNAGDVVSLRVIAIHHNRLKDAIIALENWALTAGSATGMVKEFSQTGHGFAVGDVIRYNGTSWVKAKADSVANAEAIGIVVEVPNANTFKVQCGGYCDKLSGMTPGAVYFLSDTTAGALTTTEPTAQGTVSKPLYIAMTASTGYIFNWRGLENGYVMSYSRSFTNDDLDSNYDLLVTHNLDVKYCVVAVYDNNDQEVKPDSVTLIDATSLKVNLTEFAPISGVWRIVVLAMGTPLYSSNVVHLDQNNEFNSLSEKTTLSDEDLFVIEDSVGGVKRKIKSSTVKKSWNDTADVQVFSGTSPTSWTTLDLSSYVGSRHSLVFLSVWSSGTLDVTFRPYGIVNDIGYDSYQSYYGAGCSGATIQGGRRAYIMINTDSLGRVQWKALQAVSVQVFLAGYIR